MGDPFAGAIDQGRRGYDEVRLRTPSSCAKPHEWDQGVLNTLMPVPPEFGSKMNVCPVLEANAATE
jgi:hypothetical protein